MDEKEYYAIGVKGLIEEDMPLFNRREYVTEEQIKRLVDKAWEDVWNDHLRNQEDIPINKHSFYRGFMKCSMHVKVLYDYVLKQKNRSCEIYADAEECPSCEAHDVIESFNKELEL